MDYGILILIYFWGDYCKPNAFLLEMVTVISKLEAHDWIKNFTKQEDIPPSFEIQIPDSILFKDLHGDVNIPSISMDTS